jgi:hypothetical protein
MVTIDLNHPGYREAFADCEVGETKQITITVTKKTNDKIVGELDTESYQEGEDSGSENPGYGGEHKAPKGVMIAIGRMK